MTNRNGITVVETLESGHAEMLKRGKELRKITTRSAEIYGYVLEESRRHVVVLNCRGYFRDSDDKSSFSFAGKQKWEIVNIDKRMAEPRQAVQKLLTNQQFEQLYANTGCH